MRIAIIGAGLAGLTAARDLSRAGHSAVVYDKGRSLGGRLSTRRAEGGMQFDHGAQYLTAKSPEFASFLSEIEEAGGAGCWTLDDARRVTVGTPGMSAVARYLATGIDVRRNVEIDSIPMGTGGWSVAGSLYDRVLCTIPAPQVVRLIDTKHPAADALNNVVMEPCLTLMLALPSRPAHAFSALRNANDDIAWIALDNAKQRRPGPNCWVAQAGPSWSTAHLEKDKEEIAKKMLPLVCERLEADPAQALYVAAHRWRYARASMPLGQSFLTVSDTLFFGGDWALSKRAEGAWQSGSAMASAVLETR